MSTRHFLYGLWALAIVGGSLASTWYGYSPFADGRGPPSRASFYGPTHK
jgi:tellurite resistance protein TehA-like permease